MITLLSTESELDYVISVSLDLKEKLGHEVHKGYSYNPSKLLIRTMPKRHIL